ncbi:TIGR03086 family metal-binding protein [Streptomyces flavofungini]|uniref:TIGR03086 family protein n=1 Tax=Streptomyces flavofungini TaxID=68200 RepID=A0ABS0X547_9ACTN|nr:TIGR03086 family metal-binding protein [Streptomyces flavofungini]MBJ3808312.1 TIGR03086 family protein [Streptomyces flavofungini]GHC57794.1 TIGR03086 family protein [Streptomyces flavofungini]
MSATDRTRLLRHHGQALDLFTDRVHAVGPDQWDAPTPCVEWTVRDLVTHLVVEQLWVPPLVRDGATLASVGDSFDGDVLGPDPVASWDTAADAARAAFGEPGALDGAVHLSYGRTPAADYCAQMVTDLVVHTWDLSRAIGADEHLPDDLVADAVREVTPYAAELSKSGLFAPAVQPPPGADARTALLNLLGRTP